MIHCNHCNAQYIGQTGRSLKTRFKEHLRYVRNKILTEPTGEHFNSTGHNISMMRVKCIEKCNNQTRMYREKREEYFKNKFQTKYRGMNKKT